jgi:hypothetical protein
MKVTAKIDKQIDNTLMGVMLGSSVLGNYIDKAQRIAGLDTLVAVKTRIFNDNGGKGSEGKSFGTYNSKYKEFRAKKENRTNSEINLMFTGDLEAQFKLGVNNGDYCLGFEAEPNGEKSNYPNASQKAEFMEKRFGDIFEANDSEIQLFTDTFMYELDKQLK